MNIENLTIGELLELQELTLLNLSTHEQVKRRGELLAKIFGPDSELEAITKKYLRLEVRFMQQSVDIYNLREEVRNLSEQNRKLSAHVQQLKNDSEPTEKLA